MSALIIPFPKPPQNCLQSWFERVVADAKASPRRPAQWQDALPRQFYWHDQGRVMKFGAPPEAMTEADQRSYLSHMLDRMEVAAYQSDDEGFDLLCEQLLELVFARRAAQAFHSRGGAA